MFQLFCEVEDIEFLNVNRHIIPEKVKLYKLLFVFQNWFALLIYINFFLDAYLVLYPCTLPAY